MSHRIVAVSGEASLRIDHRNLVIIKDGGVVGRVPMSDLAILIIEEKTTVITQAVLAGCADFRATVVVCDDRHMPNGVLLSLEGHSLHSKILRDQIDSSKPAQKRAWQTIVKAKIMAQADVLNRTERPGATKLNRLVSLVRSGDPDNVEGRAAAFYFGALFGPDFYRLRSIADADAIGESESTLELTNAMLNYGYAIIRACVSRAIVAAGLHPTLGIHHRNQYNAFCLADDAMEPLRPVVDLRVFQMMKDGEIDAGAGKLTPAIKRQLVALTTVDMRFGERTYPLLSALERYSTSLRHAICENEPLAIPTLAN